MLSAALAEWLFESKTNRWRAIRHRFVIFVRPSLAANDPHSRPYSQNNQERQRQRHPDHTEFVVAGFEAVGRVGLLCHTDDGWAVTNPVERGTHEVEPDCRPLSAKPVRPRSASVADKPAVAEHRYACRVSLRHEYRQVARLIGHVQFGFQILHHLDLLVPRNGQTVDLLETFLNVLESVGRSQWFLAHLPREPSGNTDDHNQWLEPRRSASGQFAAIDHWQPAYLVETQRNGVTCIHRAL